MKLPVPEFYVFYNGKEDFPSESEMKLSDAFIKLDEKHNFARFTRTKELCKIKLFAELAIHNYQSKLCQKCVD